MCVRQTAQVSVLRAFVTRSLPLTRNKNMYLKIVRPHKDS